MTLWNQVSGWRVHDATKMRSGCEVEDWVAYSTKLSSIQQSPRVHPTVVSPLRLRQLRTRSRLNCLPATRVVKSIIANAMT